MLTDKTEKALRRVITKALDDAEGDVDQALTLIQKQMHTSRMLTLQREILAAVILETLNTIIVESPEKVRGGLMEIRLP